MLVLWLFAVALVCLTPVSQAASSDCENPPLDISIVIDRTKSVGAANYDKMLDSVMSLIAKYDVGEDKTHFSIVTYAGDAEVRVSLDDPKYHSQEALQQLLQEMKDKDKLGNPTRTDVALKTVGEEVFNENNGDRPKSPNVMIIFTDGGTHGSSEPYENVLPELEADGVHRVAVGIGKKIKQQELETIAGDKDRVVNAKDFEDLNKKLDDIREVTCNIDGGYTEWSEWSECSSTCGGGIRRHSRTCTNPEPKNNGKNCIEQEELGPPEETGECNTQDCPVPGGYTDWSEWGKCSVTCGGGVQKRTRTCTNPPPSGSGPTCIEQDLGPAEEEQECNTQDCGVDGNWSPWGNPGPCDKTCGGGTRRRQRTCTNPPPSGNGKDCKGSDTKSEPCNKQPCPTEPPPPKPCKEHLDVGVIIDSSNSIRPGDYRIARQYIVQLAERLQISEAGTHMAILLYSWEAHTWHRFTDAQSVDAIRSKANSLPHIRGGTRTDRALELAAEDFFGWEDSGDRPDKPNVLIVLTDGDTNEGSKPFNQVIPPLDEADVRRVAVGIGSGIDLSELRQIASSYDDVLQVSSYGQLYPKLEAIMNMACEQQYPGDCGNWGSYGGCNKNCGGGVQVRTRTCPAKSLHLRKQKNHCNTNLCPGQSPCEDTQANCPARAASGDCWRTAQPSSMFYIGKRFPLWSTCPKSCRRCNVDRSCQDSDPYICPWWSQAVRNRYKCNYRFRQGFRTMYLRDMCKKSCGQCSSGGGGGNGSSGGAGGGAGGGGGGAVCRNVYSDFVCRVKARLGGCRHEIVKTKLCRKSCGQC